MAYSFTHVIDVYIEKRVIDCDAQTTDALGYRDRVDTEFSIIDRTFHSLSCSSANNDGLGFVRFSDKRLNVNNSETATKQLFKLSC